MFLGPPSRPFTTMPAFGPRLAIPHLFPLALDMKMPEQSVIVLEGVPAAALASLQLVGYFPVEVSFTLGADRPECLRWVREVKRVGGLGK